MQADQAYLDIHNARVMQGQYCVFEDLSLQFYPGQHCCVLGPNGAGKTTLLKLLSREIYPVVRPNSHVKIDGSETAVIWELRQKIGLVSQDLQNRYDAHVLGRDVVMSGIFGAVGMHGHFQVSPEHEQRVDEVLEQFQLNDLQKRRYWHLSTGQQRKLLLARALVHRPPILVLDEPTNGLDLKASFELLRLLQEQAQMGTTLLLVTHHIHEILPEIDRIVVLKQGKVLHDCSKTEALSDERLSQVYDTAIHVQQQHGYFQAYPA